MIQSKVIVALDFSSYQKAITLVEQLDPKACALKIGLEMFSLFGPSLVDTLLKKNFKIFLDLKFHDIPTTVARACEACAKLGVWMINLHASGGLSMMQAAKEALEQFGASRPLLIAVTVLTSMSEASLPLIGVQDNLESQASRLAQLAKKAELDGVVCSAWEVPNIKKVIAPPFLTVTPGIRPLGTANQDQERVATPLQAIELGSDFLVIGRPITQAKDPQAVLEAIISTLP